MQGRASKPVQKCLQREERQRAGPTVIPDVVGSGGGGKGTPGWSGGWDGHVPGNSCHEAFSLASPWQRLLLPRSVMKTRSCPATPRGSVQIPSSTFQCTASQDRVSAESGPLSTLPTGAVVRNVGTGKVKGTGWMPLLLPPGKVLHPVRCLLWGYQQFHDIAGIWRHSRPWH